MSGGTITPPLLQQSPTPPSQPVVPQQSPQAVLIEDRIHKTRRQVKGVDIIAGLLTLTVGTVTYLFAAALADHWLVTGGLGFWWRLLLWAILIVCRRSIFCQIPVACLGLKNQSRFRGADYRAVQADLEKQLDKLLAPSRP